MQTGTGSVTEEKSMPHRKFQVRRDVYGYACAIDHLREGRWWCVLSLVAGAERNEQEVDRVIALLNGFDTAKRRIAELEGA